MFKTISPVFLAVSALYFLFSFIPKGYEAFTPQPSAFIPSLQDPGQQTALWTGTTVTTVTQSVTVACHQGAGSVGRKTLAVDNQTGGGAVTVTVELRDSRDGTNFTSGYLAVNNLAAGSASADTATPSEAGGAFCQASVVSASSSVVTATLRRE